MRKTNLQSNGHVNPDVWNWAGKQMRYCPHTCSRMTFLKIRFFQLCWLDTGSRLVGGGHFPTNLEGLRTCRCHGYRQRHGCLLFARLFSKKQTPKTAQSLIRSSACRRRESVWSSVFPISLRLQESLTNFTAAVSAMGRVSYEWFIVIIILIRNLLLKVPCLELASCTKRQDDWMSWMF